MKKLLLIIIPFLLCGCYDYNELNDLAIISGVAIDYINEEYVVTFEVLLTKKQGEEQSSTGSYTISSKANTVYEAFAKNGKSIEKVPYFDHIETVIISEDIARNHLEEVSEYLIRSSKFRNEFYMVISTTEAKDLLNNTSEEVNVVSSYIVGLLENNNRTLSAAYYAPFVEVLSNILSKREDAILSTFSLDDDKIILSGMGLLHNYELKEILNLEDASIINLLNNFHANTTSFVSTCDKGKTVITVYDSKFDVLEEKDKISVKASINARIQEDNCDYNLKDINSYQELQKKFQKIMENRINHVIKILQDNKTDVLKLRSKFYKKYRYDDNDAWLNKNIDYNIDLKINKKGLIFDLEE